MLSWRARRQLVVLLVISLPLAAVGFWAVTKLVPEPTCFDNRKNQNELEVDCGGPCAPCELKNPQPISVFWAKAVPVRQNVFDVVALIQNQNEELSSGRVEYEFSLFDSLGEVARKSGQTFILPQERAYVIEANLKTARTPQSVEFRLTNVEWQFRKGERPNFVVLRRDYKVAEDNGKRQSMAEATIENRSALGFRMAEIGFVALDRAGNVLGSNKVAVENFLAGSSRSVKSIWPGELAGEVVLIEIEPRVNIFEQGAILRPR